MLEIGYNDSQMGFDGASCAVLNALGKQSPNIAQGVDRDDEESQGAGDQGLMFGYATNETEVLIRAEAEPIAIDPLRVTRVVLQVVVPQYFSDIGHAHRCSRVSRVGRLDGVHAERTNGISEFSPVRLAGNG